MGVFCRIPLQLLEQLPCAINQDIGAVMTETSRASGPKVRMMLRTHIEQRMTDAGRRTELPSCQLNGHDP